jgi:multidrug transporter EmrE-like cation transporter
MYSFLTFDNAILVGITLLEILTLSLMKTETSAWIIVVLYGVLGLGLRYLIKKRGIMSGNAVYDILGIFGTSLISIFYHKEIPKLTTILGIVFALASLILLNM